MSNEEIIKSLHSSIQPMAKYFLLEALKNGFDLRITSGYRSPDEQQNLYNQGRTKPGNIVTNAKGMPTFESFHCAGMAFDVVDRNKGYNIDWDKLEEIGNTVGLEHGDRGYTDLPHFQYRGGLSLEEVQQGKRPQLLPKYTNELSEKDMEEIKKELESIKARLTALEAIANKEQQMFLNRKTFKKQIKKFLPKKKSKK